MVNPKNNVFLNWLYKRINVTKKEYDSESELNTKIAKGGKLRANKEIYEYYYRYILKKDEIKNKFIKINKVLFFVLLISILLFWILIINHINIIL